MSILVRTQNRERRTENIHGIFYCRFSRTKKKSARLEKNLLYSIITTYVLRNSGHIRIPFSRSCHLALKEFFHDLIIASELTRELLSTVIWDFQTKRYLGNYRIFWYGLWNKIFFFSTIKTISMMNRPGPDALEAVFLSHFKRYKFEISTKYGYRF